ncbi:hypothetical protein K438DRAFT_1754498 [Mycena galopus ATCC 62051]|nr:hypothetical protein K438DRAFT_1754498 [Mycena galopus ATCC 62051]
MPKPLPPDLQIRQARADDIHSIATLLSLAPDDGMLYRFPHIMESLDEPHKMHVDWLRPILHDPTFLVRIAVIPADGKDKIVGLSVWMRWEADPEHPTKCKSAKLTVEAVPIEETVKETPGLITALLEKLALLPNVAHDRAIQEARSRFPSPTTETPSYSLDGMAIIPEFQGHGIGSLLVRWGLDKAAEERVPVFVGGETRGVEFYEKALGFQRLRATEWWLDDNGDDISREEVQSGNEGWKRANGGVAGAQLVWLPEGYVFEHGGEVYKS